MKKYLLSLIWSCLIGFSLAQSLEDYRVWLSDGKDGGRISSVSLEGGDYLLEKEYAVDLEGIRPSSIIIGSDGIVYGTLDNAAVFRMNQDGSGYTVIHSLPGSIDGNGLLHGQDGRLYGATTSGQIYRSNPLQYAAEVIYQFTDPNNGKFPIGPLVQDEDGVLYGICRNGGNGSIFPPGPSPMVPNQAGVIFKINPDGTGFEKLFDFTFTEGYNPTSLIIGSNGDLFGTTQFGGAMNRGVIFTMKKDGTLYTRLSDIDFTAAPNPRSPLIEYDGKLYGLAQNTVYSLDLDGQNHATLRNFVQGVMNEGTLPVELVLYDEQFYGVNSNGGTGGFGTLFTMDLDGNNYADIHQFTGSNGNPQKNSSFSQGRDIIMNSSGDLVAVISGGAASNNGIIFKLNTSLESTTIKDFYVDPGFPSQLSSFSGKLVGYNTEYGSQGNGGFFSLDLDGSNYKEEADVGDKRLASWSLDGVGDIFAFQTSNQIYKLDEFDGSLQEIYQTDAGTEGSLISQLVPVGDVLYGSTDMHIFSLSKEGTNFTSLKSFDGTDGLYSPVGLVHHAGYLYGLNSFGGVQGRGIIYKIKSDGTEFEVLKDFDTYFTVADDAFFVASNQRIYGLIYSGVDLPNRAIYSMNLDGTDYQIINDLTDIDVGSNIYSIAEGNGWLAGVTSQGGGNGFGSIFRTKLDGTELVKVADVDEAVADFSVIEKLAFTLDFPVINSIVLSNELISLSATTSIMSPVEFETNDNEKITISGSTAAMLNAGRVTVTAKGSDPHYKTVSKSQSFCIFPKKPSITISGDASSAIVLTSSNVAGNQWYLDGTEIPGATTPALEVVEQGTYTVKTTVDDCPGELSEGTAVLITALEKNDTRTKVYPNPFEDVLIAEFVDVSGRNSVQLVDYFGREMPVKYERTGTKVRINTSSLSGGLYLLKVSSAQKTSFIRLIK